MQTEATADFFCYRERERERWVGKRVTLAHVKQQQCVWKFESNKSIYFMVWANIVSSVNAKWQMQNKWLWTSKINRGAY
jgi:hypothetical protein